MHRGDIARSCQWFLDYSKQMFAPTARVLFCQDTGTAIVLASFLLRPFKGGLESDANATDKFGSKQA